MAVSNDRLTEQETLTAILKENGVSATTAVKKYPGGQINVSYQVGDDLALKIEEDLDVTRHQPDLVARGIEAGAKLPRIVAHGNVGGKNYLLMDRVSGKKLSEGWLGFSERQKERFLGQLVEQMRILHSVRFEKYSTQRPKEFDTFLEAVDWQTDFGSVSTETLTAETRANLALLTTFYEDNKNLLSDSDPPVFVHNDLHLENILYEGDDITGLIDFDFSRQAPKDYELWMFVSFFSNPAYFVEEKLEAAWSQYECREDLKTFKRLYSELFSREDVLTRIRVISSTIFWGICTTDTSTSSTKKSNCFSKAIGSTGSSDLEGQRVFCSVCKK